MNNKNGVKGIGKLLFCLKKDKGMKTTILMRILRLCLISVLCSVLIVSVVMSIQMSNTLNNDYQKQAKEISEIYAHSVSQWMDLIRQQIEFNATNTAFTDSRLSLEARQALLAEAAATTEFKDFSIAYSDGTTYNGTDISERDYFKAAMGGETYISSPVLRKTDGKMTIMVATKLAEEGPNGEVLIYGGIDADFFTTLLAGVDFGESGMGFIVGSDGTILSWPDNMSITGTDGSIYKTPAGSEAESPLNPIELSGSNKCYADFGSVVELMAAGKDGVGEFVMPDGTEKIIGYSAIPGAEGWSIAIMINKSEVLTEVNQVVYVAIIVCVVVMIIEAFATLCIATGISYPVRLASERLAKIQNGDLSSNDEVAIRSDETGVLIKGTEETRQQLNEYIGEIGQVLQGISDGRLDQHIDRDYKGDFTKIKNSLNSILDSLNQTFGKTSIASANLLEGAHQVEMASQALASASTEQASAVVEITASIEGIARTTAENTSDVMKANDLAQTAKKEADNGNEQMNHMIDAMNDISNSSQNIAKIMKVIDDISFQTNILALNASVEAARAGIHGRGFAVVAEEVRALAGKSSEAASEIADMIDDTIKKINAGTDIASETAEKLGDIVRDIDNIAGIMAHIADMSKEQAESIDQINTGIEQISSVVQNNSATSEECAASSVELSEQADSLMKQVRYFKLR